MSNKHPRPDEQPVELHDDVERHPGIGSSNGLFARRDSSDARLIEATTRSKATPTMTEAMPAG